MTQTGTSDQLVRRYVRDAQVVSVALLVVLPVAAMLASPPGVGAATFLTIVLVVFTVLHVLAVRSAWRPAADQQPRSGLLILLTSVAVVAAAVGWGEGDYGWAWLALPGAAAADGLMLGGVPRARTWVTATAAAAAALIVLLIAYLESAGLWLWRQTVQLEEARRDAVELAFSSLLDAVRSGRPAYETMYGRGFWEDVYADAALAGSLDALRTTAPAFDAHLVIDGYDWAPVEHVVDVGGGNGALLGGLLRAHPHLQGTLVDLPPAAAAAQGTFAAVDVAGRARAVGGSFFDPLPAGGDVYLLSGVLFDWDDEQSRTILRRCADAARPGGTVLVSEITLDAWGSDPTARRPCG